MSEKLMQALAAMAESRPLRALYILCDSQKQVSTGKLREYLDCAGDTLAGYATTLRHEFDMLTAAAPAAPVVQEEPVAWALPDPAPKPGRPFLVLFHSTSQVNDPSALVPLYASPPAHDAALVEAANAALKAIQEALEATYHNAYPECCGQGHFECCGQGHFECCGQGHFECCGSPVQAWDDRDQKIMDLLAPHEKALRAALAGKGGE